MNRSTAKRKLERLLLNAMKEGLRELKRVPHPQTTTKARLKQLETDLLKMKFGRDLYSHEEPK